MVFSRRALARQEAGGPERQRRTLSIAPGEKQHRTRNQLAPRLGFFVRTLLASFERVTRTSGVSQWLNEGRALVTGDFLQTLAALMVEGSSASDVSSVMGELRDVIVACLDVEDQYYVRHHALGLLARFPTAFASYASMKSTLGGDFPW